MLTYYYWPVPAGGTEKQCRKLAAALVARGHTCRVLTCRKNTDTSRQMEKSGVLIIRKPTLEFFLQRLCFQSKKIKKQEEGIEGSFIEKTHSEDACRSKLRTLISNWGAKVVRYGNIAVFSLGVLLFLAKNYRSIDILHVHTAEWIAGLAALAEKIFKLPVVCKGATMPVFPPLYAVPLASQCDIWRRKPYFIALTGAMRNNFIQNGVPDNRITVLPNGVILPAEAAHLKENNYFLYIGNFSQSVDDKGFDLLIEAWAEFHRLRPSPRLLLLGGGDAEPWRQLARTLDCSDSIKFMGYQTNLQPFFEQACCFLLPSRNEGISNALLEAQSWGLPAIVSDIPGNREVVRHRESGIIVPTEDIKTLTQAMISLYDDAALRQAYGRAARKRMEDVFAMNKVTDRTVALYKQLTV